MNKKKPKHSSQHRDWLHHGRTTRTGEDKKWFGRCRFGARPNDYTVWKVLGGVQFTRMPATKSNRKEQ